MREEFGSFDNYIWQFTGHRTLVTSPRPVRLEDIASRSPESEAMSKDLMRRGFRFVGPMICYAHMQATGMVDDHLAGCFRVK